MSSPTRYTTRGRDGGDVLVDLALAAVKQPATWVGFPVTVICAAAGFGSASVALGWIAGTITLAISIYRRRFGMTARLRQAMVYSGLVYRDPEGEIHEPRVKGRTAHMGRNLKLKWELPPGLGLQDVQDRQETIEQRTVTELETWMDDGLLHMNVLRHKIPRQVPFARFYSEPRPFGRLLIGLGQGRRGALWTDLAELPHMLVGGMTGGGKSVFLRQALTHLALDYSPQDVKLVLIDLKGGVELAHFAELPHAIVPVADTIASAAEALTTVRAELDDRLADLRKSGLTDIAVWRETRQQPPWPRILVVVDEVAELTIRELGQDKEAQAAQKAALSKLAEIARLGRAVGIHLLLSTQRPDADAVPGQLKANLPGTVAFRVRSAVNSIILLDCDRAAKLAMVPGRGLWACERIEEFQAVYLSDDESRRLLHERWGEQS